MPQDNMAPSPGQAPNKPQPEPRKRHPLGIMVVGTLTALGGLALLLVD